jgi:hypothetical protein
MSIATVTIPNVEIRLSVEQLIAAATQLEPHERGRLIKAIAGVDLDSELGVLLAELYGEAPLDQISDEEILTEIRAVRESVAR